MARLWVIRVAATVVTMTVVSPQGMRLRAAGVMLCQSKVGTDTMIITATSAAIGITATTSPRATTRIRRNVPARNVDRRCGLRTPSR